ncbi:MAG: hypothetical protein EXS31_16515 [Pedosphaera sp.]|nr:hypothetical protein [Pedosphaera sp.]
MPNDFQFDVFLSHSAKDKTLVRPLAKRLRQDGLNPKAECRRQKAETLHSSFFIHPFLRAFGSDWAQPESGTFRFHSSAMQASSSALQPSAFILLPFPDAPIQGSLAQFLYIDWRSEDKAEPYAKHRNACRVEWSQLITTLGACRT